MLFSFLLCRVLLFPFLYLRYSAMTGLSLSSILSSSPLWVHFLVLGLWTPQLLWFKKMLKGSLKIIRGCKSRVNEGQKKILTEKEEVEKEAEVLETEDRTSLLNSEEKKEKVC